MKSKVLRKSVLALCIIAAMIVSYMPAINPAIPTASAATAVAKNQTDEAGFVFTLYDDGTAAITKYNGVDGVMEKDVVFPATYTVKGEGDNPDKVYNVISISGLKYPTMPYNTTIESIVIPEGVKEIKASTIYNCDALKTVTLPESLEKIERMAFYRCDNIESIHIPANVNSIGEYCFIGNHNMKVTVAEGNTAFKAVDNVLYSADMKKVIFIGKDCPENLSFADGTEFVEQAFQGSTNVKTVVLPDSLAELQFQMFNGCTNLETVVLPSGITTVTNSAFNNCTNLKEVEIPVGVTSIGSSSFNSCANLKEIVVPKTVTFIDQQAFANCTSLESAILPDGLVELPRRVFRSCNALKFVTIPPSLEEGKINDQLFDGINDLTQVTVCGEKGSYAETFAATKKMQFVEWVKPEIKTEAINTATVGEAFEQKLEGVGVPSPIWYEVAVPADNPQPANAEEVKNGLPEGMTLSKDGVISGTPTTAGTYTFAVDAYNMGTDTKVFTIIVEKNDITDATVSSVEDKGYTGSEIKPAVEVKDGDKVLVEGTDYTVEYSNNTEIGTATVTITGMGIYEGTKEVYFNIVPIAAEKIELDKTELTMTESETVTLTATVAPENTTDKTVTWTSSDESVATVDANGVVTAVTAGTATITATCGKAKAECQVTVNAPVVPEEPTQPEQPTQPEEPSDDSVPGNDESDADEDVAVDSDEEAAEDADKADKDDAAQTGDNSNMMPFFLLMIAALAVAGTAVYRRKID